MKTKISFPIQVRTPPARLLLPQFCPVAPPASDLDPHLLARRAATITTVLVNIVEQRGYFHWGINE